MNVHWLEHPCIWGVFQAANLPDYKIIMNLSQILKAFIYFSIRFLLPFCFTFKSL